MTDKTTQSIRDQAEALLTRVKSVAPDTEPFSINYFVKRLLAHYGRIAAVWETDDVLSVRPNLTAEQAWEVLEEVGDNHDASWGINWTTLETVADDLFDRAPETDEA